MTPAENAGLREFISEELRKVHTRMDLMYAGQLDFQEHVAGHFGKVYTRLDDVSTRLDGVTTRLDGVTTRLDDVNTRLDGVTTRLDDVNTRLDFGRRLKRS
jgi:tetrahydromethanopterin S-methyltransferase subunit G